MEFVCERSRAHHHPVAIAPANDEGEHYCYVCYFRHNVWTHAYVDASTS